MKRADEEHVAVVVAFECLFLEDLYRDDLQALPIYQKRFKGLEPLIADEYGRLLRLTAHVGADISADPGVAARTSRIGPYRVLRELGRGGMGVVYSAMDDELQREVAVKVLSAKSLFDPNAERRFEFESHTLAKLQHPGIVTIHRYGRTEGGEPYFAMEQVRGVDLSRFLESHPFDVTSRVRILLDACRAVSFAHQNGIIHRDLKPSNILVSWRGFPEPASSDELHVKVLDFGLARMVSSPATGGNSISPEPSRHPTPRTSAEASLTESGAGVGTLSYMAPELLQDRSTQADVRSDVYSLGVVLYEALIARRRFATSADRDEKIQRICSTSALHPRGSNRAVPIDLDWVVAKATSLRPSDRYQSAEAFSFDLAGFLENRAVSAHPPSPIYETRKIIGRHPLSYAAFGSLALSLILGGWGFAYQKERHAISLQAKVDEARESLLFSWRLLGQANPNYGGSSEMTVVEMLESVDEQVDRSDLPALSVAALLNMSGKSLLAHGKLASAERQLERALIIRTAELGANRPETLTTLGLVAGLRTQQGELDEAEAILRGILRKVEHRPTLRSLSDVEANTLSLLGHLLSRQNGRQPEAVGLFRRALATPNAWREDGTLRGADARRDLAGLLLNQSDRQGSLEEAEELLLEARHECVLRAGEEDVRTAHVDFYLAWLRLRQDRPVDAVRHARHSALVMAKKVGPTHKLPLQATGFHFRALLLLGRRDEADDLLQQATHLHDLHLGGADADVSKRLAAWLAWMRSLDPHPSPTTKTAAD